ncbi:UNVERIFIED_CONTAM: hypothetical protein Sradi_1908100 [Sesamum radiatum]|uniref:Secreted protein n=1 Tax=Sesamum radiatum TaxID=300843 RepID=A0AAW2TYN9_SESRA
MPRRTILLLPWPICSITSRVPIANLIRTETCRSSISIGVATDCRVGEYESNSIPAAAPPKTKSIESVPTTVMAMLAG